MFDTFDYKDEKKHIRKLIITMLCAEGKSLADFPQMKQFIENDDKKDDYIIFEGVMEVIEIGTRQYEQLKQKEIVDFVLNRLDTNNHNSNYIYIDGPDGSG